VTLLLVKRCAVHIIRDKLRCLGTDSLLAWRAQSAIDEGAFRSQRSVFEGKPDMHVILPTALEIASALEYLHSNNVLHGALSENKDVYALGWL